LQLPWLMRRIWGLRWMQGLLLATWLGVIIPRGHNFQCLKCYFSYFKHYKRFCL
jgi:hypothetical protein